MTPGRQGFLVAVVAVLLFPCPLQAANADGLDAARTDLVQGRADDALAHLRTALKSNDQNAEAHNLYCRVAVQLEQWDEAVSHCERAVALSARDSNYHLWLGRTYGFKAERSSMLSAFSYARKLKSEFELAVSLDSRNVAAMSDLGEFYCSAPSVVGGGTGKAEDLAPKLLAVDPVRGHELQSRIADEEKDYGKAESELKAAIAASPHPASQWMALASFYRKRGRMDEMVQAIKSGIAADKAHTDAQVDGASTLIRTQRELPLAGQMLRDYIASSQKSEDAPVFAVHVWLGNLLAKQGDSTGAQSEYQAALALAHDYKPAISAAAKH